MDDYPIRLSGQIWWIEDDSRYSITTVDEAILKSRNEIALDFTYERGRYTVVLKSEDHINFSGQFTVYRGPSVKQGRAGASPYENDEGYFLHGTHWVEEHYNLEWMAKLEKIIT